MRHFLHRIPAIGGLLLVALFCAVMASAEYFRPHGATITVTNTNDSGPGSLRQAIADANDGDTITFAVTGTIGLTSGELLVSKSITISGPGADNLAVDGNATYRVFHIGFSGGIVGISGLTITNGHATAGYPNNYGAGILNDHAALTVDSCTISGNTASWGGGGIANDGDIFSDDSDQDQGAVGVLEVSNSTISGNSGGYGGGIVNYEEAGSVMLTLSNSTISDNSAQQGGGIANFNEGGSATVEISNTTFSGNSAPIGGGIWNYTNIAGGEATVDLASTILKAGATGGNISNQSSTVTSLGYNLSSDNAGGYLTGPGDQINTDPLLGPLQDNGGPTFTHALLPSSPAIDAGDPNFTPPPFTDQRGYLRVYNERIDIGSFELQPIAPTPTVTPTPSPISIDFGITMTDVPDPVQVNHDLTYTMTVTNHSLGFSGSALVVDNLPPAVNFVSVTPSQGFCTGTTSIMCFLDSVQSMTSVNIVLVVRPTGTGTLSNTAQVFYPDDPNPSNDASTAVTMVIPDTQSPTPTPTSTSTPTSTPTPTLTPTPTPSPTPAAQPLNLSTRLLVQTGDNVGIGGFIITGNAPKQVVLRGIGPSLGNFGVPNPLADPVLELHGPSGFVTITNDNWRDGQDDCSEHSDLWPTNNLESMICATLDPGPYTAVIRGTNNASGVGLVEVYDVGQAAPSKLANISTRAFVSTGNDIVIAGFILGGNTGNDNVILRGIGPSLGLIVPNPLSDPTLELRDGNGVLLITNDNWQDDPAQAAIITAAGLALPSAAESGIAATLPPGQYTALLAGLNSGTGVGLVEVYDLGSGTPGSTPTPTPTATPISGIVLVSRLSDARAFAAGGAGVVNPPPEIQTDFLPASLSNNAMSYGEPGGADGHCTSNSQIAVDNQIGPLQVTGDGMARADVGKPGGFSYYAWASAKLIVISFTLTDRSYAYSLTGQLSADGNSGPEHPNAATAKLTAGNETIFEVIADHSTVTLSETGILQPDNYILAVDIDAYAEAPSGFGNSRANFNFALGPTPTPTPTATASPTPGPRRQQPPILR